MYRVTDTKTTRDKLIDTTQALLWERGYAATSPRAVLAGAGVGQGSMYHHFTGKEELALAAFERNADAVLAKAEAVLHGPGGPRERIVAYLELQRDVLKGCPVGRMAGDADVLATASLSDMLDATFQRVRALMVEVVDEAQTSGDIAPGTSAADLAETVLAVVQGGYVLARAAGSAEPFERAVRGAVALLPRPKQTPRKAKKGKRS